MTSSIDNAVKAIGSGDAMSILDAIKDLKGYFL